MIKELLKQIKEDGEVANGGQGDLGAIPNNPLQMVTGNNGTCWGFRSLIQQVLGNKEKKLKRKLNKGKITYKL